MKKMQVVYLMFGFTLFFCCVKPVDIKFTNKSKYSMYFNVSNFPDEFERLTINKKINGFFDKEERKKIQEDCSRVIKSLFKGLDEKAAKDEELSIKLEEAKKGYEYLYKIYQITKLEGVGFVGLGDVGGGKKITIPIDNLKKGYLSVLALKSSIPIKEYLDSVMRGLDNKIQELGEKKNINLGGFGDKDDIISIISKIDLLIKGDDFIKNMKLEKCPLYWPEILSLLDDLKLKNSSLKVEIKSIARIDFEPRIYINGIKTKDDRKMVDIFAGILAMREVKKNTVKNFIPVRSKYEVRIQEFSRYYDIINSDYIPQVTKLIEKYKNQKNIINDLNSIKAFFEYDALEFKLFWKAFSNYFDIDDKYQKSNLGSEYDIIRFETDLTESKNNIKSFNERLGKFDKNLDGVVTNTILPAFDELISKIQKIKLEIEEFQKSEFEEDYELL